MSPDRSEPARNDRVGRLLPARAEADDPVAWGDAVDDEARREQELRDAVPPHHGVP